MCDIISLMQEREREEESAHRDAGANLIADLIGRL